MKEVRGFLGLTGYYRCFLKVYAQVTSLLTEVLKKNAFCWTEVQHAAFLKIKAALANVPVLYLPNF